VAVAKEKNQAAARDSLSAKFCRFLNDVSLRASQIFQEKHRLFEKRQAGLLRTHCVIEDFVWHG
jgi:hypothetical protein